MIKYRCRQICATSSLCEVSRSTYCIISTMPVNKENLLKKERKVYNRGEDNLHVSALFCEGIAEAEQEENAISRKIGDGLKMYSARTSKFAGRRRTTIYDQNVQRRRLLSREIGGSE